VVSVLSAVLGALAGGGLASLMRAWLDRRVSAGDIADKALRVTNDALTTVQALQAVLIARDKRIADLERSAASCRCGQRPM
jgi:hypothetical protein